MLLILLLRKRQSGAPAASVTPAVPAGNAMPMRLEVVYGEVQGDPRRTLYLTDSLFIGSEGRCGPILPDAAVAPVNTRIFLRGGIVYIEDLNSPAGTALGGMRIYAPNPLRSGDEIMIGPAVFRLYF